MNVANEFVAQSIALLTFHPYLLHTQTLYWHNQRICSIEQIYIAIAIYICSIDIQSLYWHFSRICCTLNHYMNIANEYVVQLITI